MTEARKRAKDSAARELERLSREDIERETPVIPALADDQAAIPRAIPKPRPFPNLQVVGPYRIEREIARGGMGRVFRATQQHPKRAVALKLMTGALHSETAVRRFEYESEVLARLQHPNIAHVYDSGTLETEQVSLPWYAMELVENSECIDTYAAKNTTTLSPKLALFLQVCDGIQHAHQKGIIHRDLKPANILINAEGHVKLIDFGIAKAVLPVGAGAPKSSPDRDLTSAGQLVGTLAYMSPEQTFGNPAAVDVRSDVYALGVLLYELCTGSLPYDVKAIELAQAIRRVRDDEPARGPLEKAGVPTDLRIIIGKALAKAAEQRFESAASMAADVRRFLRLEPIEARPPSLLYQLGRFSARNRFLVASASALLVMLVAGVAVSSWGLVEARHAQQSAESERDRANVLVERAEEAERQALSARDFAGDLLYSTDPWETPGGSEQTVRELLDRASRRLDHAAKADPVMEIEARRTLGKVYGHLSIYESAEQELSRALKLMGDRAPSDPTRLSILNELIPVLLAGDKTDHARELAVDNLELHRRRFSADDPRVWEAMSNHASALSAQGDLLAARDLHQEVVELRSKEFGDNDPRTLEARAAVTHVQFRMGDLTGAESSHREILEGFVLARGEKHPQTLGARKNLLGVIIERGDHEEAERMLADLIVDYREVLGPDHEETMGAISHRAIVLRRLGRFDEALPLAESALASTQNAYGSDHVNTLRQRNNYALLLVELERDEQARDIYESLVAHWRTRPADPEGSYLVMAINYAKFLDARDRTADAIRVLEEFRQRGAEEFPAGFWLIELADERLAGMSNTERSDAQGRGVSERARAFQPPD
jgi:serine/threonine protein kinase